MNYDCTSFASILSNDQGPVLESGDRETTKTVIVDSNILPTVNNNGRNVVNFEIVTNVSGGNQLMTDTQGQGFKCLSNVKSMRDSSSLNDNTLANEAFHVTTLAIIGVCNVILTESQQLLYQSCYLFTLLTNSMFLTLLEQVSLYPQSFRMKRTLEIMSENKAWREFDSAEGAEGLNRLVIQWLATGVIGEILYTSSGPSHNPRWTATVIVGCYKLIMSASKKKDLIKRLNKYIVMYRLCGMTDRLNLFIHWTKEEVVFNIYRRRDELIRMLYKHNRPYLTYIDFEFIAHKDNVYPLEAGIFTLDVVNGVCYRGHEFICSEIPKDVYTKWQCAKVDLPSKMCILGDSIIANINDKRTLPDDWLDILSKSMIVYKDGAVDHLIMKKFKIPTPLTFDIGSGNVNAVFPMATKTLMRLFSDDKEYHNPSIETKSWHDILSQCIEYRKGYDMEYRVPLSMPANGHCALYAVHQAYCNNPNSCSFYHKIKKGVDFEASKSAILECCVIDDTLRKHIMHAAPNRYDLGLISQFIRCSIEVPKTRGNFYLVTVLEGIAHLVLYEAWDTKRIVELRQSEDIITGYVGCDLNDPRYKILNVTNCSQSLKHFYLRAMKLAHPDKGGSNESVRKIVEAYESLTKIDIPDIPQDWKDSWREAYENPDYHQIMMSSLLLFSTVVGMYVISFIVRYLISMVFHAYIGYWNWAVRNQNAHLLSVDKRQPDVYFGHRVFRVIGYVVSWVYEIWILSVSIQILQFIISILKAYIRIQYGMRPNNKKKGDDMLPEALDQYLVKEYTIKEDHPYSISRQLIVETINGVDIEFFIYWMPTIGYCPITAAMFYHYITSPGRNSGLYKNADIFLMSKMFDSDPATFYKIVRLYIANLNLVDEQAYSIAQSVELFENINVPASLDGGVGLVVSNAIRGYRHFGILSQVSAPMTYKLPTMYCSRDVMVAANLKTSETVFGKKQPYNINNRLKEDFTKYEMDLERAYDHYLSASRMLTGIDDTMVLVPELSQFLSFINIKHKIYSVVGKKSDLVVDAGEGIEIQLKDLHYTLKEKDINLDKNQLKPSLISITNQKDVYVKPLVQDDKKKSGFAKSIKIHAAQYGIIDFLKMGGSKMFFSYHWTNRGVYFYKNIDYTVYCEGNKIQVRDGQNKFSFPRSYGEPADDLIIGESRYRNVEYFDYGPFYVVVRSLVDKETQHLEKGTWRYELRKRFSYHEKHYEALLEWYNLDGKADLVKLDFKKSVSAVRLYCQSTTFIMPDIDWVSTHLVMVTQEADKNLEKYVNLVRGDFRAQSRYEKNEMINSLLRALFYEVLPTYVHFAEHIPPFVLLCTLWLLPTFLCSYQYLLSLLIAITYTTAWTTSMIHIFIRKLGDKDSYLYSGIDALSRSKMTSIFSTITPISSSLLDFVCYWRNEIVSLPVLLLNLIPKKDTTKIWNTPTIPQEYWKKLSGYADASRLGGIWALLERQTKPKLHVQNKSQDYMRNSSAKELAEQIIRQAYRKVTLKTWPTYLSKVLKRKQSDYKAGKNKTNESTNVSANGEFMPKPWEKQHKEEKKTRALMNPSRGTKAMAGWAMDVILGLTKETEMLKHNIASGKSPSQVEYMCDWARKQLVDPCMMTMDGAQWDSHQHRFFIDHVDNTILNLVFPKIGGLLGLGAFLIRSILRNITNLICKMKYMLGDRRMLRNSKYQKIATFKLKATVYSGHPSKTTWGNTTRALLFMKRVADDLNLRWNKDIVVLQAGDDTLIFIERKYRSLFKEHLMEMSRNYGLVFQDILETDYIADFLSNDVIFEQGQHHLFRKPNRFVQTGVSAQASKVDNPSAFDVAICQQLQSYGRGIVGMQQYIDWRSSRIDMSKSSSKAVKRYLRDFASEYKVMEDEVRGDRPTLYRMDQRYKMLAGSLGDPHRLLGY